MPEGLAVRHHRGTSGGGASATWESWRGLVIPASEDYNVHTGVMRLIPVRSHAETHKARLLGEYRHAVVLCVDPAIHRGGRVAVERALASLSG